MDNITYILNANAMELTLAMLARYSVCDLLSCQQITLFLYRNGYFELCNPTGTGIN